MESYKLPSKFFLTLVIAVPVLTLIVFLTWKKTSPKESTNQKDDQICQLERDYENSPTNPITCKCPSDYEFKTISIGWGKCPKLGQRDCPVAKVRCEKIESKQINTEEAAIETVKNKYPEVQSIYKSNAEIGKSMDIRVKKDSKEYKLEFWQGYGDCPAGCINEHYWYFIVSEDGEIQKVGEYKKVYNSRENNFIENGYPLWDFLK